MNESFSGHWAGTHEIKLTHAKAYVCSLNQTSAESMLLHEQCHKYFIVRYLRHYDVRFLCIIMVLTSCVTAGVFNFSTFPASNSSRRNCNDAIQIPAVFLKQRCEIHPNQICCCERARRLTVAAAAVNLLHSHTPHPELISSLTRRKRQLRRCDPGQQ